MDFVPKDVDCGSAVGPFRRLRNGTPWVNLMLWNTTRRVDFRMHLLHIMAEIHEYTIPDKITIECKSLRQTLYGTCVNGATTVEKISKWIAEYC